MHKVHESWLWFIDGRGNEMLVLIPGLFIQAYWCCESTSTMWSDETGNPPAARRAMAYRPCTMDLPPYLCGMKILMVCLGNICRSPLAEGILQKKANEAGLHWTIESAGTNGYHTGEPPHHLSQKVARKNGVDISCQVARRFSPEDFDRYDKIYAMANDVLLDMKKMSGAKFNEDKADLFLNVLHPGKNMDVPDPWFGDEDGYHEVYALIEKACSAIVENYLAKTQTTA